jgi:Tol biopolymer transport system component
MDRLHTEGTGSTDRLPSIFHLDAGRGLGAVGALLLGGAVLALAMLVGLTLTGSPAGAAFPGTNGKIACHGIMDRNLQPDPGEDDYEIYTINPDGSDMTYLTDNVVRGPDDPPDFFNDDIDPNYSPDGKTIAFTSQRNGGPEVYTMNADGTNVTRLTTAIGQDRASGWSADGRTIYFFSARDGNNEIYKMNADGSDQTRLTFNEVNDPATPGNETIDVFPVGSPDGRKIAFSSSRDGGDEELYTMNPDGSDVTRLTNSPSIDRSPNWSPDGKEIVFWSDRAGFNPGSTTSRNSEIYKMNADGTGVTRLTDIADDPATTEVNESVDRNPAWSPDGKKIVFNSQRTGDPEVHSMNADGSEVTRLTNAVSVDEFCDWQPIPIPAAVPPSGDPPPPLAAGPGAVARILPLC